MEKDHVDWLEVTLHFRQLYCSLKKESDRGAVIIAAVFFDELLQKFLMAKLLPSVTKKDKLFSSASAPLWDFGVKIEFAYRIGLIGRNFRSSLDLIRRLRNDFAHTVTTESFSTPSVQSRLRELFTLQRQVVEAMWQFVPEFDNPNIARGVADVKPAKRLDALVSMVTWRGVFDFLVCAAIARLSQELKVIQRVIPPVHPFK